MLGKQSCQGLWWRDAYPGLWQRPEKCAQQAQWSFGLLLALDLCTHFAGHAAGIAAAPCHSACQGVPEGLSAVMHIGQGPAGAPVWCGEAAGSCLRHRGRLIEADDAAAPDAAIAAADAAGEAGAAQVPHLAVWPVQLSGLKVQLHQALCRMDLLALLDYPAAFSRYKLTCSWQCRLIDTCM